jgi:hypothetical protein
MNASTFLHQTLLRREQSLYPEGWGANVWAWHELGGPLWGALHIQKQKNAMRNNPVWSGKKWGAVACAASVILTAGCASIVSKSDWPVTFSSNPKGAEIVISDKSGREIHRSITPTTLTLPASSGYFSAARYEFEVKMAGYTATRGTVSAGLNGWYLGNLLFGGLVGLLVVDPATGAMFRLPEDATVNLTKTTGVTSKDRTLRILALNDIPSEWKTKLVRVD